MSDKMWAAKEFKVVRTALEREFSELDRFSKGTSGPVRSSFWTKLKKMLNCWSRADRDVQSGSGDGAIEKSALQSVRGRAVTAGSMLSSAAGYPPTSPHFTHTVSLPHHRTSSSLSSHSSVDSFPQSPPTRAHSSGAPDPSGAHHTSNRIREEDIFQLDLDLPELPEDQSAPPLNAQPAPVALEKATESHTALREPEHAHSTETRDDNNHGLAVGSVHRPRRTSDDNDLVLRSRGIRSLADESEQGNRQLQQQSSQASPTVSSASVRILTSLVSDRALSGEPNSAEREVVSRSGALSPLSPARRVIRRNFSDLPPSQ